MGFIQSDKRHAALIGAIVIALTSMLAPPSASAKELVSPVGVFVEGGVADDARSVVVGAAWTWVQPSKWGAGNASGYLETSLGEWACRKHFGGGFDSCSTQVGLTPVIRYQPSAWERVFLELGIGADAIFPEYQSDKHRFATEFNFGDHLGLGYKLDDEGRNELELRAEHYSNGGYKNPNPGEDWVQLRYMYWF